MRYLQFAVIALILLYIFLNLFGCGQRSWTKRGERKGWIKHEMVYDTVYTQEVKTDSVFKFRTIRDTVFLKQDKLTVKYFYNNTDSTVYLSGECESDTIRVEKIITNIEIKEKAFLGISSNLWALILFILACFFIWRVTRK